MIIYRATLDMPAELLRFVTRLLILERRLLGTPAGSRCLTCREQAILALRWFRDRTRPDRLAADHGISRATAYRYVAEAVAVLSAQAPGLDDNAVKLSGIRSVINISTGPILNFCGFLAISCHARSLALDWRSAGTWS